MDYKYYYNNINSQKLNHEEVANYNIHRIVVDLNGDAKDKDEFYRLIEQWVRNQAEQSLEQYAQEYKQLLTQNQRLSKIADKQYHKLDREFALRFRTLDDVCKDYSKLKKKLRTLEDICIYASICLGASRRGLSPKEIRKYLRKKVDKGLVFIPNHTKDSGKDTYWY